MKYKVVKIFDNWETGFYEVDFEDQDGKIETYETNQEMIDKWIKEVDGIDYHDLIGQSIYILPTALNHKNQN